MAKPISAALACASAAAVFSWRAVFTVDEVNEFTSTAAMPTTRITSIIINAAPRRLGHAVDPRGTFTAMHLHDTVQLECAGIAVWTCLARIIVVHLCALFRGEKKPSQFFRVSRGGKHQAKPADVEQRSHCGAFRFFNVIQPPLHSALICVAMGAAASSAMSFRCSVQPSS